MPGFQVLYHLLELAQTHVHWVRDAIQPSLPLWSPSPPAIIPSIRVFSNESALHIRWPSIAVSALASVLPMNIQGWSPCSPRDSQESSLTPQFRSINSSELSLLYGPTLTSIHNYWKNHSFDLCQQSNVIWSRLWFFQWSCMDVRVGLWRKLSAEKLMLLNYAVGEDSWESLGLQGDPTSPS